MSRRKGASFQIGIGLKGMSGRYRIFHFSSMFFESQSSLIINTQNSTLNFCAKKRPALKRAGRC